MKRLFFMAVSLLGAGIIQAQVKEGTIVYERKINMHRNMQDEQMKAMIPEFRTSKHLLQFSDSVSIYKLVPEDEAPDPFAGGGGMRMVFRGGADAGELYKNFSQARSIQATELAGKNYLIADAIQQQPWKLGTETKQVMGYTCHKASRKIMQPVPILRTMSMSGNGTRTSDSTTRPQTREVEVVAWFADDIISPVGPESYGQLPGVILELDIDNGQTVYTATEVKKSVDLKDLKEPKKGKTVTRDEYNKLMSDMMNSQMQGMPGGVRIRMN